LSYAATFFVTGVVTNIAWRYAASGRRLIEGRVADSELMGISKTFLVGPIAYDAATLMALASAEFLRAAGRLTMWMPAASARWCSRGVPIHREELI
jgi:hypothetical protein